MIELIKELPDNVIGIVARGRVTNEECDHVLRPAMEASLKRHDKLRFYYEIGMPVSRRRLGRSRHRDRSSAAMGTGGAGHRYKLGAPHGPGIALSDRRRGAGIPDRSSEEGRNWIVLVGGSARRRSGAAGNYCAGSSASAVSSRFRGLDLGGLLLDQLDQMVDDVVVL